MSIRTADVVVVGGGAAGTAAAVAAARCGASTVLIERGPYFGGAATLRGVLSYCGLYTSEAHPRRAVSGVADDIEALLRDRNGASEITIVAPTATTPLGAVIFIDPEAAKSALDDLIASAGVQALLGCTLTGTHRDQRGHLAAVSFIDFGGTAHQVTGSMFIDATGDAALSHRAGATVTLGSGGRMQTATLSARFGGIPATAGGSDGGLAATIRCELADASNGLDSPDGFIARLPGSGDIIAYLADEDVDATDATDYSEASQSARRRTQAYLHALQSIPGCSTAYLVGTGPELGIRESRHMTARQPLRDDHLISGYVSDDTVALAAWPGEMHLGRGKGTLWNPIGGDGVFGVVLDNLRSVDVPNLFGAGRVLSGGTAAASSVRVMGTAFATGQAAGVAAAHLVESPGLDKAALTEGVRSSLTKQRALLKLP